MTVRWTLGPLSLLLVAGSLVGCSGGEKTLESGGTPSVTSGQGPTIITPQQLNDMMTKGKVYLVNVHVPYEGEIPGTDAFISYTDIASRLGELPFGEQPVVIYCRSGVTSAEAAKEMIAAGAPPFYEVEGGYTAWQAAGFPFTQASPPG
jgi:rhodanese-related sulfurtransferase